MKRVNSVVTVIIIINVFIYGFALLTRQENLFIFKLGLNSPYNYGVASYLTSAFMHSSLMHLGFNMLFLYFIGPELENYLGKVKFLIYYLCVAIISGFLTTVFSNSITIGASGALYAIMTTIIALDKSNAPSFNVNSRYFTQLLVINLIFTFVVSGISIMGHFSGIVAGIIAAIIILFIKEKR